MHLLPARPPSTREVTKRFRTSPWPPALAFALILAFALFFVRLGVPAIGSFPWIVWIVAGPLLFVVGAAVLLMLAVFWSAWRATLRDSNWILALTREGLFLNLRSYLNAHFPGQDPSVAFLPFREIASAGKVNESWQHERSGETETRQCAFLEVVLKDVDTSALAEAVRVESTRPAPERAFLGIKMRARSSDVPVFVAAPGVLRVQWKAGMESALRDHVAIVQGRQVDLTDDLASRPTDERCLALLRRGDKLAAVESARTSLGIGLAEARDRVEALERRSA